MVFGSQNLVQRYGFLTKTKTKTKTFFEKSIKKGAERVFNSLLLIFLVGKYRGYCAAISLLMLSI